MYIYPLKIKNIVLYCIVTLVKLVTIFIPFQLLSGFWLSSPSNTVGF